MVRLWLLILGLAVPVSATAQTQAGQTPAARAVPVVQPPKPPKPRHPPAPLPAVAPAPPPPAAAPAPVAAAPEAPAKGSVTNLPLPRFAALRSDDVNLRAGPGTRYQIEWVYHRRDLPVEIEREFDAWRLVSDMDGVKGWVHAATLIGRRTFITRGTDQTLRRAALDTAAPVAVLRPGVVGRVLSCAAGAAWCEVQVADYRGYLPRAAFWGTYPDEAVGN